MNKYKNLRSSQRGKVLVLLLSIIIVGLLGFIAVLLLGEQGTVKKEAQIRAVEALGNVAVNAMAKRRPVENSHTHGSAVDLIHVPIEVKSIADNIYYATGVGNTMLIATDEGNVVFDTGLPIQSAKQLLKLRDVMADAPVTHVIVSHSHQDHTGGVNLWLEPGTEVVTHREFAEEQRYLTELQPYLHQRNRALFPWIPEAIPDLGILNYGGVKPTVLVDEGSDYRFQLGGVEFVVISTPGAEGADNICLWLPQQKILFTGDFFGPQFPQFPNIFTMRGEKVRKPVEYIRSLNKLIALQPEMIVPSHFNPTEGREQILANMIKMRDAVQYVHDETIAGMNAGKSVYELMRDIQLPPELDLVQNHGRVSWGVKSLWEYYATWFHFDSTTELYPVPAREVYSELGALIDMDSLLAKAQYYNAEGQAVHALHMLEVALAADPYNQQALALRLASLQSLMDAANAGLKNDYEINWLKSRMAITREQLDTAKGIEL